MDYSQLSGFEINGMVGDIIFKSLRASKPEASGNNTNKQYYGNADTTLEPLNHLPDHCNDPSASWPIIEKYKISTLDQLTEWCVGAKGVSPIFDTRPLRAAMIVSLLMQGANNAQPVPIPSIPERKHRAGLNVYGVDSIQVQRIQKIAGKGHAKQVDTVYIKECVLEGMARTQVMWLKEGIIKA